MSTTTPERHEFQTEVRQLLDLMIHSLYSHKDIFLRELISNASDALDKLRFEAITRPELQPAGELEIRLEVDPAHRTLSVWDNGIGMAREDVVQNIGTIARSGTREFLKAVQDQKAQVPPELIGQFGVGFYSSFMVAERIVLVTRKAGEETATMWESTGDGYQLGDAVRETAGTDVSFTSARVQFLPSADVANTDMIPPIPLDTSVTPLYEMTEFVSTFLPRSGAARLDAPVNR